jgi:hypothetical protein
VIKDHCPWTLDRPRSHSLVPISAYRISRPNIRSKSGEVRASSFSKGRRRASAIFIAFTKSEVGYARSRYFSKSTVDTKSWNDNRIHFSISSDVGSHVTLYSLRGRPCRIKNFASP